MRVLIVHGDADVARRLERGLARLGLSAVVAAEPRTAARRLDGEARCAELALTLLDPGLPSEEVGALLSVLARRAVGAPVAWITARDLDPVGADGPRAGGDLAPRLVARIRALLGPEPPIEVHDLVVDTAAAEARRAGRRLELTPTEASILVILARRAGEPVSRGGLLRDVWGIDFDTGTNVVDVHIRRLRSKLDDPFPRPLLHTVRGRGYMLAATAVPAEGADAGARDRGGDAPGAVRDGEAR